MDHRRILALIAPLFALLAACAIAPDEADVAQAANPRLDVYFNSPATRTETGSDANTDDVLVQTLDREELRFDLDAPARFEGLEGGEALETDPRAVRAAYLTLLREHVDGVNRLARSFGADALVCDTHESVGPVLAAVLDRRMSFTGRRGG